MILQEIIIQIAEDFIANTDYYLVDAKVTSDNRIFIEIDCFQGVSIDFCTALSHHIESKLDREVEDYELEVSSAGLTEPFKVPQQYEKNLGKEVEVVTKDGKKQTGVLKKVNTEEITLEMEKLIKPEGAKRKIRVKDDMIIPFYNIKTTKYIIRFK